ncbi:MAG: hypothetical protein ACLPSW_22535 [Roseiarcus sp.]
MSKDSADPTVHFRNLSAGYTDAIRVSDFKANIGILFVAFMMGPILGSYTKFPDFLPIPIVMLPFLAVYFCLLAVLMPRYPKRGRKNFVISRSAVPSDFQPIDDISTEVEQLKLRCAVLSEILYWKTLFLRISFILSMVSIVITLFLLIYIWY